VCDVLALLFVLYGLVFGLGGVARDRDDGTLEIELSLPIPRWVGGMARWIASTLILATFFTVSVALLAAILPTPGVGAVIRNGVAACGGGVAIGLVTVGTAGIKQGFSGPFALAMSSATGLAAAGPLLKLTWLPVGSLFAGGDGWAACAVALGLGFVASALYGWRTGVT
jgi:ABC-type transport system involved in multi-copper enzyme maturation permease subunit